MAPSNGGFECGEAQRDEQDVVEHERARCQVLPGCFGIAFRAVGVVVLRPEKVRDLVSGDFSAPHVPLGLVFQTGLADREGSVREANPADAVGESCNALADASRAELLVRQRVDDVRVVGTEPPDVLARPPYELLRADVRLAVCSRARGFERDVLEVGESRTPISPYGFEACRTISLADSAETPSSRKCTSRTTSRSSPEAGVDSCSGTGSAQSSASSIRVGAGVCRAKAWGATSTAAKAAVTPISRSRPVRMAED